MYYETVVTIGVGVPDTAGQWMSGDEQLHVHDGGGHCLEARQRSEVPEYLGGPAQECECLST